MSLSGPGTRSSTTPGIRARPIAAIQRVQLLAVVRDEELGAEARGEPKRRQRLDDDREAQVVSRSGLALRRAVGGREIDADGAGRLHHQLLVEQVADRSGVGATSR